MTDSKYTEIPEDSSAEVGKAARISINWRNLLHRRRLLSLIAALLAIIFAAALASLQPLRSNALGAPDSFSFEWWLSPIESNAFKRLPVIPEDLNDVVVLPGDKKSLVAVGDNGLILRSPDSGRSWRKGEVPFFQRPPTTGQRRQTQPLQQQQALPQQQQQQQKIRAIPEQTIEQSKQPAPAEPEVSKKSPAIAEKGQVQQTIAQQQEPPRQQESPASILTADAAEAIPVAHLSSVFFIDGKRGWAVGDAGTVLASVDGGRSWQARVGAPAVKLSDVFFVSRQRGWIIGDEGTCIETSDGGQSWRIRDLGTGFNLNAMHFVDSSRGWIVGKGGTVFATFDGGRSWERKSSPTESSLHAVAFADAARGWAVGDDGLVLGTTDGGDSWQRQSSGTAERLDSVRFVDRERGWASGREGVLIRTRDAGRSWQAQRSGTKNRLRSVRFIDAQRGWAVGHSGVVLATDNAGADWWRLSSGAIAKLSAVYFADAKRGWAVGADGLILATRDGGITWDSMVSTSGRWLNAVHFADARHGWAVGEAGEILATRNGGISWQPSENNFDESLEAVFFADSQYGWAVGDNGVILATRDGGASWARQPSGAGTRLLAVSFVDRQSGWVAGRLGQLRQTSNGGESWNSQNTPTNSWLDTIHFDDKNNGWAAGRDGVIIATDDGGKTWRRQDSNTGLGLEAIHFVDPDRGWAVGEAGVLIATIDGGGSWEVRDSGVNAWLRSVFFHDANRGWAVGHDSSLIRSEDGGRSWRDIEPERYPAPWYYLSWIVVLLLLLPALNPKARVTERAEGKPGSIANQVSSDRPLQSFDTDRLGFRRIAQSVSRFLRHEKTTGPLTLAVSGRWGSGKSSLMNLISADLQRHGFVPVWFNAWHNQSEENLLEALVTHIRQQGRQQFFTLRPPFINPYWFSFFVRRVFRWSADHYLQTLVLVCAATVAITFYGHDSTRLQLHIEQMRTLVQPGPAADPDSDREAIDKEISSTAVTEQEGNREIGASESEEGEGARDSSQDEKKDDSVFGELDWLIGLLSSLITLAGGPVALVKALQTLPRIQSRSKNPEFRGEYAHYFRRFNDNLRPVSLVVFIDDLDRCNTETVMRTLEATNYLVSSGNCFVILGMDYDIVRNSIAVGYDSLTRKIEETHSDEGRAAFANEYLEKLINIQLEVPDVEGRQMLELAIPPTPADGGSRRDRLGKRFGKWWMNVWRIVFLSGVIYAGVQLGDYLHEVSDTEETAPATAMDSGEQALPEPGIQPRASEIKPGDGSDPPPRDPAGEVVSTAVRDNSLISVMLPLSAILLVAVWVVVRGREDIQHDSREFEHALEIWLPLASCRRHTPRAIKRFVNRTRYFAMRLRDAREYSDWRRDNESTIVALSAIHQLNPDILDLPAAQLLENIAALDPNDSLFEPDNYDQKVAEIKRMVANVRQTHEDIIGTDLIEEIDHTLPLFREISKGIQIK